MVYEIYYKTQPNSIYINLANKYKYSHLDLLFI